MRDAELQQRVTNLATANAVVLGAVCAALAKAGAIEPAALMNHLESVRREWLERTFGVAGESEGVMYELMQYLEIQADFPPPSLPAVFDNKRRTPPD